MLIRDSIKRNLYTREIAKALDIEEKVLGDELRRMTAARFKKENNTPDINTSEPQVLSQEQVIRTTWSTEVQEKQLIKVLLLYGGRMYADDMSCAHFIYRAVSEMDWDNQDCYKLFTRYKESTEQDNSTPDVNYLIQEQPEEMRRFVYDIITEKHQLSPGWEKFLQRPIIGPDHNYKDEVTSAVGYLRLSKLNKMLEDNLKGLAELETDDAIDELFTIHIALLSMKKQLVVELGHAPAEQEKNK